MAIFDLNRWDCFLSVKGCGSGGFTRYDLLREELLVLNSRVTFCLLLFFVGINFHTKTNQYHTRYLLLKSINSPPTQVHHELTCCHNFSGGEGEEADEDKNWGGYIVKAKVG